MKEVTYTALMRNKQIKDFLVDRISDEGLALIEILFKAKKYVSEFTLAERSAIYVNTVRSLLYKLYENKIVNYNRKREKTRGWYIYSWKFNPEKLAGFLIKQLQGKRRLFNDKASSQSEDKYFYCKDCDIKLLFAEAMEYNFACPNCFKQMDVTSPNKENKAISDRINKLNEEIKVLRNLKVRLDWMEELRREEERKQLEKEEAERQALADKGMYYCTQCDKTHKLKSKIGDEHKDYAK
ncbi:MAG: hypothetical protein WC307_01180 [Candidatus Nanoarchaeia archaeon]|jgi:transcription initiation factor TFIIE subunit alpha